MQRGRSTVSIADLIGADLLQPGQQVSFRRSSTITGVITNRGTISVSGTEYASPSTAAKAAAGGVSTNGWVAWRVRRGGEWNTLAQLRDQLLSDM